MVEIGKASIEFVGDVSADAAEEIVTDALRIVARRLPDRPGVMLHLTLPTIEAGPGVDGRTLAEVLADALVRGISDGREDADA